MIPVHEAGHAFVLRLLADAERHAAEGRSREAMLLLGWASRGASHDALPAVLLAYHRIRATTLATASAGSAAGQGGAGLPGVPRGPRQVGTDALGFPVPRFPTRVPELDCGAFVPIIRAPAPAGAVRKHAGVQPPRVQRRLSAATVAGAVAITLLAYGAIWLRASTGVSFDPMAEVEAALREGDAAQALALIERIPEPPPGLLVLRGRTRLTLGDTLLAASDFRAAAADPRASPAEALEAARVLATISGEGDAAADAYVDAFSAGLPPEQWGEVIDALRKVGRVGEAGRVAALQDAGSPDLERDGGEASEERRPPERLQRAEP